MGKLMILILGATLLSAGANAREVQCHATIHRSFTMMSMDDLFCHQQELLHCEQRYSDAIDQCPQDANVSLWKEKKLRIETSLNKLESEIKYRFDEAMRVTGQYDIEKLEELMASYNALLEMDVSDSIKNAARKHLQEVRQSLARYESLSDAALDGYDIVEDVDDEYVDIEMDLPDYTTHRLRHWKLFSRMKRSILHLNQSYNALTLQQINQSAGLLGSAGKQPIKKASKKPMIKVTGNR